MKLDFARLNRMFNPRSVVVIGDKDRFQWLRGQSTFQGRLYSVQISPGSIKGIEALGVKNYTSLLDIPDTIDLAIVAVPRAAALSVLEDCIKKGLAGAHFFTAGFSETGTEEGRRMELQLIETAKRAGFYIVGPNCMGIFNPKVGIRQNEEQYTGFAGPVGFISQSGTHARNFALTAHVAGVDINKSVSFGNGVVLGAADYLEYFGQDSGIKAVGMYLEGARDGRRLLSVLRRVSEQKPVVIWKGGRTQEGARAIASHTASLAVPQAIWESAVNQAGAVKVRSMEELVDALAALLYLSPVPGNRVGIAGGSGGQSVAISDAFAEDGLAVPRLTQKSYDEMASFFSVIGASYGNPIDTGSANRRESAHILEILERDANIDSLVVVTSPEAGYRWETPQELDAEIASMAELRKKSTKPVMVVLPYFTPLMMDHAKEIARKLRSGGIPTFPTFERTARAIKNALAYYSFKRGSSDSQSAGIGKGLIRAGAK